jgi:HAD superfamily hydrolase (TIGR01549 family)
MNGTLTEDKFIELVWRDGIPRLYSQVKNIPFKQAMKYVFHEYDKVGDERVEWYDIKYWFRFFDLGEGWRELLEGFQHEIKPFPEVIPVLEDLSQDYTLVVTTNAISEFADIELGAAGIKGYFACIFSSTSDFGEVKKSPETYLKICQILNIKPEEMAHVGDHHYFDFITPQELGIKAFYLDRKGREKGDSIVRDLGEFSHKLRPAR